MTFRIFATTDIGPEALQRLRDKGWGLEVYEHVEPPPRALILEKVRSGIDALITTLRDKIDEEVFAAGKAAGLKVEDSETLCVPSKKLKVEIVNDHDDEDDHDHDDDHHHHD